MQSTLDIQKKIAEVAPKQEELKESIKAEIPKKEEKKAEPNPHLAAAKKILADLKELSEETKDTILSILNTYEKESHPIEPYLIAKGIEVLSKEGIFSEHNREFIFNHPKEALDFANVMIILHENQNKGLFNIDNLTLIKKHISELYHIHLALRYLSGKKISKKDQEIENILTQDNFNLLMGNLSYQQAYLADVPEVKKSPVVIKQVPPDVETQKKQMIQYKEIATISQICSVLHELRAAEMLNNDNFNSIMNQPENAGRLSVLMNLGMTRRSDLKLFLDYLDNPTPALEDQVVKLLLKTETAETLWDYFSKETIQSYIDRHALGNIVTASSSDLPEIEEEEPETPRMRRN